MSGTLTVICTITLLLIAVKIRHDQRHPEVLIAQARQALQTMVLPGSVTDFIGREARPLTP